MGIGITQQLKLRFICKQGSCRLIDFLESPNTLFLTRQSQFSSFSEANNTMYSYCTGTNSKFLLSAMHKCRDGR